MSNALPAKLLTIQKSIGAVSKSSNNPHFKSKYADLNEVLDVAKEALNAQNIFIVQSPGADAYGKFLETSLVDGESGQTMTGKVYFSGSEDNMQKIGAAITYARRFGLVSLLALESEDDDGETAVGRGPAPASRISVGGKAPPAASTSSAVLPTPVAAKVSASFNREKCLEKISLTSKVIIDSKRATQEEVEKLLFAYAVKDKTELNDDQAQKLLIQLEEKLK